MYVKVPALEGVPMIGSRHLFIGVSISPDEAVCHVVDGELEEGWVEITEEEFRQYVPEPEPYLPEQETTDQKLARIYEQNIILMDALATTFEELIALRELVEGGTK
jgi:hypothetical protein